MEDIRWIVAIETLPILLQGALITIQLTVQAVATGTVIGTFIGMARLSKKKILKIFSTIYVEFIRGTPLLVQLVLIYYGLPQLGINLSAGMAAFLAFGINSGAYVAEIVRGGIQSIDKGQMEAARSLGMTHGQAMRYIILPQAFKRILPPLGNEFIMLLKDSSLVMVLGGVRDLMRRSQAIIARNFQPFPMYLMTALIYLIMTLTLSQLVRYMERRMAIDDRTA